MKIIKQVQREDFEFLEEAIQQIKDFYNFVLHNQIAKIFELNDPQLYKILKYFTGKPIYLSMYPNVLYHLDNLTLFFPIISKGSLKHIISAINLAGFYIESLYQYFLKYEKIEVVPIKEKEITIEDNGEINTFYLYVTEEENFISFSPIEKSSNNEISVYKISPVHIKIIDNNEIYTIDYTDLIQNKKYIPSNIFKIIIRPFYKIRETIWYGCANRIFEDPEKYLINLIELNKPAEFVYKLKLIIGEKFQSAEIDNKTFNLLNSGKIFSIFDSYHFLSNIYNSIIKSGTIDFRTRIERLKGEIYDPNICISLFQKLSLLLLPFIIITEKIDLEANYNVEIIAEKYNLEIKGFKG